MRSVVKLIDTERQIADEYDTMLQLRTQVRDVINALEDPDERLVLRLRYILGLGWDQIGEKMNVDESTARRWHRRGLDHVKMPQNPIKI